MLQHARVQDARPDLEPRTRLALAATVVALAAVYFGAAKLGLALAFEAEQVTAVWPPTGIALAAVLRLGYRVWPGVALGAFLANATTVDETLVTACGIAAGNTLEALTGAWLLHRMEFRNSLERVRDVLRLILFAAVASTMVSATIGVTTLCLTHVHSWAAFRSLWSLWWLGDAAGALLVAPLLLTWADPPRTRPSPRRAVEMAALLASLILVSLIVFAGVVTASVCRHPLEYTIFPFLAWAALRFGQRGTTGVISIASGIAIWGTVRGYGPFAAGTPHENLILLQVFMAVIGVTALLLSGAITERRRTEEAVQHHAEEVEKLMEIMPVAIFLARDPDCKDIIGNRAAYQLLRVSAGLNLSKSAPPGELPVGFKIFHAGREMTPAELPMQYAATHGVEVRDYDEEIVFDDGTVVHAYGAASPLFDKRSKVRGCIAAFMDVTELRRLEQELRQKVGELAAADRRKDEFLATLAHELRNPLAPIRNSLHLLQLAADNRDIQQRARTVMERQLAQMVRLIDDLLDVSRITRSKLQLRRERIDLATALQSAREATQPLIDGSNLALTVTLPPEPIYVDADTARLAQVFTNLLNNAAKYTERGGHIWLTAQREAGEIVVSVRDTGIGIAAEHVPHLFEMFSQVAPALERSQGGLGIGLALVRGLVELHGGCAEARSAGPGLGSEFIVRLPVVPAPALAPESGTGLAAPFGPGCRILVVDDNRDSAESLGMMLRVVGHDIRTAHDGLEALQAAAAFQPQVVLLDIGLPKLNGYEVSRRLRQEPWGKEVLLIALTGWGQEEDRQRALEAGFNHHLTKPPDPNTLLELLPRC
jgi:signal transduction histidine kinase/integral membrane sensor domain MASE1/CheY-like chemotaxis protein